MPLSHSPTQESEGRKSWQRVHSNAPTARERGTLVTLTRQDDSTAALTKIERTFRWRVQAYDQLTRPVKRRARASRFPQRTWNIIGPPALRARDCPGSCRLFERHDHRRRRWTARSWCVRPQTAYAADARAHPLARQCGRAVHPGLPEQADLVATPSCWSWWRWNSGAVEQVRLPGRRHPDHHRFGRSR